MTTKVNRDYVPVSKNNDNNDYNDNDNNNYVDDNNNNYDDDDNYDSRRR